MILSPGDVLCVQGERATGITRLGAVGGYMGHVMLVTGPLRCVQKQDKQAIRFGNVWPNSVEELWLVRTTESTRDEEGVHETDHILYVDDLGQMCALAEDRENLLVRFEGTAHVQV